MAKKSQVAKTERLNAKPVLKARVKNRCNRCGRPRGYIAPLWNLPDLLPSDVASGTRSRRHQKLLVSYAPVKGVLRTGLRCSDGD